MRSVRQAPFALPAAGRITLDDAIDKLSALQRRLIYLPFFNLQGSHADRGRRRARVEAGKDSRESSKALDRLEELLGRGVF